MNIVKRHSRQPVVTGILVDTLPAGQEVSSDQMRKYYDLREGDKLYAAISRASEVARLVILRDGTSHYVIVPKRDNIYIFES